MLVLSRRPNETVVIETPLGDVTITCVRSRHGVCAIGIDTPDRWPILRGELQQQETSEGLEAR